MYMRIWTVTEAPSLPNIAIHVDNFTPQEQIFRPTLEQFALEEKERQRVQAEEVWCDSGVI
jgi:hypothetical protein